MFLKQNNIKFKLRKITISNVQFSLHNLLNLMAKNNNKQKKMNKTRLLGAFILIIGIVIMYTVDNDLSSFISGVMIGIGGALTIGGKTIFSRTKL